VPSAIISIDGREVELLPERAAFLRAARALVVADLHVGKSESYRRFGVPAADGIDEETLVRLSRAAMRVSAKVIVVVGDLTHSADGIGEAELARFAEFRERCSLPMRLVEGNHDRGVRTLPSEWCVDRVGDDFELGGIRFRHEPPATPIGDAWTFSGHLHPMLSIAKGTRWVETPAFVVDHVARTLVLPAFSRFTRGVRVAPRADLGIYAVAEHAVVGPIEEGASR
jgi:DNA ligase-associated metallophosphoesterase